MKKKTLAIVVPVIKSSFDKSDLLSLKMLDKHLAKYDKIFLIPQKLNNKIKRADYTTVSFPDKHFVSVSEYSKLLLTRKFYLPFAKYEYILIHQLDAIVNKSNISKFINGTYDYLGAPLFNSIISYLSSTKRIFSYGCNGGLSLRKVDSFIKVIENAERDSYRSCVNLNISALWFIQAILTGDSRKRWLKAAPACYPFHEDGFWSYEAPKYYSSFKIAPQNVALEFSFERFPRKCFSLNKLRLPFGVHAWSKYDRNFWLSKIDDLNVKDQ